MRWIIFIPLFFVAHLGGIVLAQMNFKRVVTSDFETNWISTISQDTQGYIWIGTQDGMYRYDGYDMLAFRNKPYETNSPPGNWVRFIDNTNENQFRLAVYGGGLSEFNLKECKFVQSENASSYGYFLKQVVATKSNQLFTVSDDVGLLYLKSGGDLPKLLSKGSFSQIVSVEGNVYISKGNSLFKFDFQEEDLKPIGAPLSGRILCLKAISKKTLLLGTEKGLSIMDVDTGKMQLIWENSSVSIISNVFNSHVYFSSENKLYKYPLSSAKIETIQFIEPPLGDITFLYFDTDGFLWMGTEKGLWKEEPILKGLINAQLPFHARRILKKDGVIYLLGADGLILKENDKTYKRLFEDEWFTGGAFINEKIWIGNSNGEILILDAKGNLLSRKRLIEKTVDGKYIVDFVKDTKGHLWAGSFFGIHLLDMNGNAVSLFQLPLKLTTQNQKIVKILIDKNDRLWVITAAHGIFMVPNISSVQPNSTMSFEHFTHQPNLGKGLTSNIILSIDEAPNGVIWCGTDSGVVYFDEALHDFTYLKINENLFDKKVMSVKSDVDNNLWITTIFSGIYFYDKSKDSFINYTKEDGLISNAFLFSSSYYDAVNNTMYFGSDEGIQEIHINHIERYPPRKKPWISSMVTYSKSNTHFIPITSPSSVEKFQLSYESRNVTVNFSSIDFHKTNKIKYAYSLNGEPWTELPERTGHFTNLPIGDNSIYYTCYFLGEEPQDVTGAHQLVVAVSPPFYRTNTAYLLYFLGMTSILIIIFRLLLKNRIAKEKVQNAQLLDEAKNRMYANISHEFKTPLTLINGLSSKLLKKLALPEGEKETLTSIRESGEQLSTLVNQMLELGSLDNNKLQKNEKRGDIVAFVKKCVLLFKPFTDSRQQTLLFASSLDSLIMDIDDDKLQKIINNLLSNAVKFTPKGGKITVSLDQLALNQIRLEIIDTGQGIKEEHLPYIFDRYYKTFDIENNLGSGIGMALTKGLVEFLEGSIVVESKVGKGTKFVIKFPIKNTIKKEEELQFQYPFLKPTTSTATERHFDETIRGITILVVEDHLGIRNFLKEILQPQYHVLEATNGKKALQISESKTIDFIISDVMMPQMNGFEFCEKIKKNPKTSHIPFIMVTARTDSDSRLKGYQLGIDAYIEKPFREAELVQIIENLLAKREEQFAFYSQILEMKKGDAATAKKSNPLDINFIKKIQEFSLGKQQDHNMESLAKELLMSRTQLHRKIKQLTNMSITQYINHIKLEKAKNLLLTSTLTVSEIAYEVGYEDPKYFSKVFKKEQGKTPSSFRDNP
ncbi:MAG: response regulator [Flavobacteriaceae bacterium]